MFVPSPIKAKGFSGNKSVKLTWIKPMSNYNIDGYFIILEKKDNNPNNQNKFDMYIYDGTEEMIEYIITGLDNNIPYSIFIFSKNSQGISDSSNKITLIPKKSKSFKKENISNNSFSDSLQNYYNYRRGEGDSLTELNRQIKNMDFIAETNNLKDILVNKIVTSEIKNLNVNIF